MSALSLASRGYVASLPGMAVASAGWLDAMTGAAPPSPGADAPDELHLGARVAVGRLGARVEFHAGPQARVRRGG